MNGLKSCLPNQITTDNGFKVPGWGVFQSDYNRLMKTKEKQKAGSKEVPCKYERTTEMAILYMVTDTEPLVKIGSHQKETLLR